MKQKEDFLKHLAQTTEHPILLEIDSAKGIYIKGKDGKAYMDMISGIAVNSLGHGNSRINEALKRQIDKHLHVMVYGEFIQESQLLLSKNLRKLLPSQLDGLYIVNSGAEAIEAAIKLCKAYTGRKNILSFSGAYHGSTNGALSISSNKFCVFMSVGSTRTSYNSLSQELKIFCRSRPSSICLVTTLS